MRFQPQNCVHENVSNCKLCQVENERFGRNSLSKSEKVSNRTDLKNNFKNLSKSSALSNRKNLSSCPNQNLYKPVKTENLSSRQTLKLKAFSKTDCVSSGKIIWPTTEEATRRGGLRAISCQAEKQLGRKDAHRKPVLPHLTGS
jgi:hypothetical protein